MSKAAGGNIVSRFKGIFIAGLLSIISRKECSEFSVGIAIPAGLSNGGICPHEEPRYGKKRLTSRR
jgi:hypothetical protein